LTAAGFRPTTVTVIFFDSFALRRDRGRQLLRAYCALEPVKKKVGRHRNSRSPVKIPSTCPPRPLSCAWPPRRVLPLGVPPFARPRRSLRPQKTRVQAGPTHGVDGLVLRLEDLRSRRFTSTVIFFDKLAAPPGSPTAVVWTLRDVWEQPDRFEVRSGMEVGRFLGQILPGNPPRRAPRFRLPRPKGPSVTPPSRATRRHSRRAKGIQLVHSSY